MEDTEKQPTSHEKRELKRQQKLEQREQQSEVSKTAHFKKHAVKYGILAVAVVLVAITTGRFALAKGHWDDFAKCLTDNGAVMYGAMDWCKYTQEQAAMFDKSFKFIDYHDYSELPDIKTTPTWVINGKRHERVQSFQKLSELTGCEL